MFSEFEKYIFRNRERVQPFRDGKIRLCDTMNIGSDIVYNSDDPTVVVAHNVRPCFCTVGSCAVIFKSVLDSRENAVHVAVYDELDGFSTHSGRLTAEDEVTYVTQFGEIYKLNIHSGFPYLIATATVLVPERMILLDDYFCFYNLSKSMLPYIFYSYDGKYNDIERKKHLGSMILFTMYLYLRNSPTAFSDKDADKEIRDDLLFANEALSYQRIEELIDYLKNQDNYNDALGELFEITINNLKTLNVSSELLAAFFDKLFTLEYSYSDEDEKIMFTLDPLGDYFERRYQAEKHHKVGKYFMALDRIADAVLLRNNALSILSNYNTFEEIAKKVVDE